MSVNHNTVWKRKVRQPKRRLEPWVLPLDQPSECLAPLRRTPLTLIAVVLMPGLMHVGGWLGLSERRFLRIKEKSNRFSTSFVPKSTECYRDVNLILCLFLFVCFLTSLFKRTSLSGFALIMNQLTPCATFVTKTRTDIPESIFCLFHCLTSS